MNDWSTKVRIANNIFSVCFICLVFFTGTLFLMLGMMEDNTRSSEKKLSDVSTPEPVWIPPDSLDIPEGSEGERIRYGKELIVHTALYLGPFGSVSQKTNGMNCGNCHLRAGTSVFGNNYSAVASTYPKFRARSGTIESVEKRINDCIERSLNGEALPAGSHELEAISAYILWVGKDVGKGTVPVGAGIPDIPLLAEAADPEIGKPLYARHCSRCHGANAAGVRKSHGREWLYPPLAGDSSYNTGAGMYRLSRLAGFIKANMPFGQTYDRPLLTDNEAWHIAAYINSLPRPIMDLARDWPDLHTKPFDHPFGPYTDSFTELQHKYGPFGPIKAAARPK